MSKVFGFVEWKAGWLRTVALAFDLQNETDVMARRAKRDKAIFDWLAKSTWWQRQWYTCGSLRKNSTMKEIEEAAWDCNISGLMRLLGICWRIESDSTGENWVRATRGLAENATVLVNAEDSGTLSHFAATHR